MCHVRTCSHSQVPLRHCNRQASGPPYFPSLINHPPRHCFPCLLAACNAVRHTAHWHIAAQLAYSYAGCCVDTLLSREVWCGSNNRVMQGSEGRHICAQCESERTASSPGVEPVGPCMCCLSFSSRRRRQGHSGPYTCIFRLLHERPHLGHSIILSLLWAHRHAGNNSCDTPGLVTKSSSVVELESGTREQSSLGELATCSSGKNCK